ncbi:MAG: flagellar hook-length control protein FliK, partial [Terrimicrobiaceae bacterium]
NPVLEAQLKESRATNLESPHDQENSETSISKQGENISQPESPQDFAIEKNEESLDEILKVETYSDNRGTESAPADDEMIAMATMDGVEIPTQPLREPAITSINRLAAYATLDRNAVTPLTQPGESNDSGLGNNAAGLPTSIQALKSSSASPSTQAAGLFKSLAPELDKFKQTNSSQVQLDLPVGEEESVRIKLSMRGGEIRSTFITESPELREALQKAWPEFSQNSRERGYRLGDPSFQQSFNENTADLGHNNRRQPEERPLVASEVLGFTNPRKTSTPGNSTPNSPSTALWA